MNKIEKTFFLSSALWRNFRTMVRAVLSVMGLLKIEPKIQSTKEGLAYTDGITIFVNPDVDIFDKVSLVQRFAMLRGLVTHELSHLLFTNFKQTWNVSTQLGLGDLSALKEATHAKKKWYVEGLKKIEAVSRDIAGKYDPNPLTGIFLEWENSIEDAYIEAEFAAHFPEGQQTKDLKYLRRFMHSLDQSVSETAKELDEKKLLKWNALIYILHQYATSETVIAETRADYSLSLYQETATAFDYVDVACTANNTQARLKSSFTVCILFADAFLEMVEEAIKNGTPVQKPKSVTTRGTSTTAAPGAGQNKTISRGKKASGQGQGNGQGKGQEKGQGQGQTPGQGQEKGQGQGQTQGQDKEKGQSQMAGQSEGQGPGGDADSEDGDEGGGGYGAGNSEFGEDGIDSDAAKVVKSILGSRETDPVDETNDIVKSLRLAASSIPFGETHKNARMSINIVETSSDKNDQWQRAKPDVDRFVARSIHNVEKAFEEKQNGGTQNGLYFGDDLNFSDLFRKDLKVFQKKKLPEKTLDAAVAILVDQSGSMCGSKIATARTMALVMQGIATKLKMPSGIYGHCCRGNRNGSIVTEFYVYQDFSQKADPSRIMGMQSGGCNRDGYALRFAADRLQKRPEKTKILFFVCDGQPASDDGYDGDVAKADLQSIHRQLRRQGVVLVVAAIDENKEEIKEIYGDAFLNITHLNLLPQILPKKLMALVGMN